jgi:hypothetical protein
LLDPNCSSKRPPTIGDSPVGPAEVEPRQVGVCAETRPTESQDFAGRQSRDLEGEPTEEGGSSPGRPYYEAKTEECLKQDPNATARRIAEKINRSASFVTSLEAWKRRPNPRRPSGSIPMSRERQLTDRACVVLSSNECDPAQRVETMELVERDFLERSTPAQRAEYHRTSDLLEREATLRLWAAERAE